ncbi:hypothetical protein [Microcoleus sp. FACHB-1515]|uniref:hypothetical protein n=1 Tax=Microcoleus sp. FACHB-1515 TaxID=2692821 RepID=UPI0018F00422|nr:hypothetical protein [Microcoleus sp. FACHB-1515]
MQTVVSRTQYQAATAAIAQAQANLQEAQLQLSYTNITAPESGHIGRKTVEVGQQVTAGQPVMAFNHCFYFIGIALLLSGIACIFLKKMPAGAGGAAH